jgi:hypothetical protein
VKNSQAFKKEHKKVIQKKGRLYAKIKINENLKDFINSWLKKNHEKTKDMGISNIQIFD